MACYKKYRYEKREALGWNEIHFRRFLNRRKTTEWRDGLSKKGNFKTIKP